MPRPSPSGSASDAASPGAARAAVPGTSAAGFFGSCATPKLLPSASVTSAFATRLLFIAAATDASCWLTAAGSASVETPPSVAAAAEASTTTGTEVPVGDPGAEAAVTEHCRVALAGYKQPRRYEFVDELPRNAYGKVLKRELRDRFS